MRNTMHGPITAVEAVLAAPFPTYNALDARGEAGKLHCTAWAEVDEALNYECMKEMLATERAAILALRTSQPWRVLVLPWEGGGLRYDTEETVARWLFGEACAGSLKGLLASTPTGGHKMVNKSSSKR